MTVDNANEPHRSGAATRANERIHRAVSADGTEIAGRVQGLGPPLILVHGAYGDGEIAWKALLPYLTDRYSCYLPSTRGRGLSSDNPDHSPRACRRTSPRSSTASANRSAWWAGQAAARGCWVRPPTVPPWPP